MDISRDSAALIFAIVAFLIGGYGLLKGSLAFGLGDGGPSSEDREITGNRARLVSLVLVSGGVALLFSITTGAVLILAAIALAWLLSR